MAFVWRASTKITYVSAEAGRHRPLAGLFGALDFVGVPWKLERPAVDKGRRQKATCDGR